MRRNAIVGSFLWCGLLLATISNMINLTWIELLFLFAPLVIFPLGIILTDQLDQNAISYPERFGRTMQLPAAILATASFLFQPGILAATLAIPWLGVCVLFALGGALRIGRGAYAQLEQLCNAVSFLYLAVGGSWLFASRLGLQPMDFQEPIVLLTGIHFHYAGFAAPLLARSVARALTVSNGRESRAVLLRVMIAGVLAAPGALALGFVIGPRTKLLAALLLAASEIGLAVSFVGALRNTGRLSAEILLTIAAASVGFSMAFAAIWAIGEYPLQPFVHLGEMEAFHGTANAFGFTLCGLLGWIFAARNERQTQEQPQ